MSPELVATALFYAVIGALVMYISAQKNTIRVYETRRSVCLLEAALNEAANSRSRDRAKGPRDKGVIYLGTEWECLWWSDQLGVSPRVLTAAVREVGPMASDIKRYFRRTAAASAR
jgi:hypothetical protein